MKSYRKRLAGYESDKSKLLRAGLSHIEYAEIIKKLAEKWGV